MIPKYKIIALTEIDYIDSLQNTVNLMVKQNYTFIYCSDSVGIMDWGGVLFTSLDQDLASVGQHDLWLWIKALNKGNTYMPSMRYVGYLSCR